MNHRTFQAIQFLSFALAPWVAAHAWAQTALSANTLGTRTTQQQQLAWATLGAKSTQPLASLATGTASLLATDATPPTIRIIAPNDGTVYSTPQTISIQVDARDNVGVTQVDFYENGLVKATRMVAPFSFDWEITGADVGTHKWAARAYDAARNTSLSAAINLVVNIDVQAPTVSIASPETGSTYSSLQTVVIQANVFDDRGVTKVEYYDNDRLRATLVNPPFNYNWVLTAADNGSHRWTVRAYDAAQNVRISDPTTLNVTIDATPPQLLISSPSDGTVFYTAQAVIIQARATDNVAVARVDIYQDGIFKGSQTSSPYNFAWLVTPAQNGSHIWVAKAFDTSQHVSEVALTLGVNIDPGPPTVSIAAPADGSKSKPGQIVLVQASASDNVGLSKVEFYDNDLLKGSLSTSPYTYSWIVGTGDVGSHAWTVKAYDLSENVALSAPVTVTVGPADPLAVSISSPTSGSTFTISKNVPIEAKPTGGLDIIRVEFYDNGTLRSTQTAPPFVFNWAVTAAENGVHQWVAKAYDSAQTAANSSSVLLQVQIASVASKAVLLGWSDTGLHEMNGTDHSIYSLVPPFNTVRAQLVLNGKLVTSADRISVTYEAAPDSSGLLNATSQTKGNFYEHVEALFGRDLRPDEGLAGFAMPGPLNSPQPMTFDATHDWFSAEGIPLLPYPDEAGSPKNPFPLMRLIARDTTGSVIASTDVVMPVSDEMDCISCHASGSPVAGRPASGWIWDCEATVDFKLNILRSHDDNHAGSSTYVAALRAVGYNPNGLTATVLVDSQPVLCLRCHGSEAMPNQPGTVGIASLTQVIHRKHASVHDASVGVSLNDSTASAACLRCHAGPESRYLRGAHRKAVHSDGTLTMSCQDCHGTLSDLAAPTRRGWLDQPSCQNCHTGTAARNNGEIRYTNLFSSPQQPRVPVNLTFGTQTNVLSTSPSLFRQSSGHGGLQCAACHGTAHAELSSSEPFENQQSQRLQNHIGVLSDCTACHLVVPKVDNGGPHGLHPLGLAWMNAHSAAATPNAECQSCHGTNYRGTVLSLKQASESLALGKARGERIFWGGSQIGCYNCHDGPKGDTQNGFQNHFPVVQNLGSSALSGQAVTIPLLASDADRDVLALRIVTPPTHGTVALNGALATYWPSATDAGLDSFTYAAWDGSTDSDLGTVSLTVSPADCVLTATAAVPAAALPNHPVAFRANASLGGCTGVFSWDWDFGDGSPHRSTPEYCHVYSAAGEYRWKLTVQAKGLTRTLNGVITISPELGPTIVLKITQSNRAVTVTWPADIIPTSLESTETPGQPDSWRPVVEGIVRGPSGLVFETPAVPRTRYFRVRRVP